MIIMIFFLAYQILLVKNIIVFNLIVWLIKNSYSERHFAFCLCVHCYSAFCFLPGLFSAVSVFSWRCIELNYSTGHMCELQCEAECQSEAASASLSARRPPQRLRTPRVPSLRVPGNTGTAMMLICIYNIIIHFIR